MLDELGGVRGARDVCAPLARRRELVTGDVLVAALGDVAQGLGEGLQADLRAAGALVAKVGEPRQALAASHAVAELLVPGHGGGGEEGEEGCCGVHFCWDWDFFGVWWVGGRRASVL